MPRILLPLALICSYPFAAFSQAICAGTAYSGEQSNAMSRTGTGTPYSLTATITSEMKLADGNRISGFLTSYQARDSQGRTRIDQPNICSKNKEHEIVWSGSIEITDPIDKKYIRWQAAPFGHTKIAYVQHMQNMRTFEPSTAEQELESEKRSSSKRTQVEDLGKRNIEGLEATGFRVTRTEPAGERGNSMPLVYIEEKWISDKYRVILTDIITDPFFGIITYQVTRFVASEPDPSLFQPPAGYTIDDRP